MLKLGRSAHLSITPDGPRGPRRQVQPGLIYLAARTGLPVVPAGFAYDNPLRARSWDRFAGVDDRLRSLVASGHGSEATALSLGEGRQIVGEVSDSVDSLVEINAGQLKADKDKADAELRAQRAQVGRTKSVAAQRVIRNVKALNNQFSRPMSELHLGILKDRPEHILIAKRLHEHLERYIAELERYEVMARQPKQPPQAAD